MSPSRPPEERGLPAESSVRCPHCDSSDVELEAAFGGSLMSRQYYCRSCRTVFEWIKWEPADPSGWLEE
jgi:hypothetical protein